MTQQLAQERPTQVDTGLAPTHPTGLVAAAAAVRGAAVAAAGLLLSAGLATLIWAITPASGQDVGAALRGGVVGFAAANLMPVGIGGVTLSLPPLSFTLVIVALLASTARRGRFLPEGRYQETVSVLLTALVYGVIVAATTRGFGPPGAVAPQWVWTASAIAVVASGGAMLQRGSSWHEWFAATAPAWLRAGVRVSGVGLGVLLAGGGLAVTVALISHFGDAVSVAALAAPSWLDGLGLSMLGLAYLPNAVIAGAGYVTGVGFEIGPGTYSPFSTVPVDLPAVPLFAAVPDAAGRSWIGLIFLAVPVAAGYLVARVAIRQLPVRFDRVLAAGLGGVVTGGLLAGAVAIARGGIGDGRWSTMGSPPLLVGAAAAVEVGVIAVTLTALTGSRTVPWRAGGAPSANGSTSDGSSPAESPAGGRKRRVESDSVEASGVEAGSVEADSVESDSNGSDSIDADNTEPGAVGSATVGSEQDEADSAKADRPTEADAPDGAAGPDHVEATGSAAAGSERTTGAAKTKRTLRLRRAKAGPPPEDDGRPRRGRTTRRVRADAAAPADPGAVSARSARAGRADLVADPAAHDSAADRSAAEESTMSGPNLTPGGQPSSEPATTDTPTELGAESKQHPAGPNPASGGADRAEGVSTAVDDSTSGAGSQDGGDSEDGADSPDALSRPDALSSAEGISSERADQGDPSTRPPHPA